MMQSKPVQPGKHTDSGNEKIYPNGARVIVMPGFSTDAEGGRFFEQIFRQMLQERQRIDAGELARRQDAFWEEYRHAQEQLNRACIQPHDGNQQTKKTMTLVEKAPW